ncbi:MAG TPA: ADOP family duplicated permease [Candidatus Acidoferrum sp.]|jgi:predicted permease
MRVLIQFIQDFKYAFRSLSRAKGLALTVILTLALGIGANAAIFSLVRGVLLRPLANRDENRLIYIRQSAPGLGNDDVAFSVPEIQDLKGRVHSVSEFGDFSVIGFTMLGLGEPREIQGGVVGGNYFDAVGLHPILGRLIGPQDDGPNAAGVVVLTYRFWNTALKRDPSVIGTPLRLESGFGERTAKIIGVLEPSVPYPQETEIIANVVTSPHHLSATMVTGRVHRMTEVFGRLAPGATLDQARAELRSVYSTMKTDHADAYPNRGGYTIDAKLLRDQLTSDARTILLILLAASGLLFVIACSNAANLILARTVRREAELTVRAALGASTGALRRSLLAESLLLCTAGAALGVFIAGPLLGILSRYASRFSVRALDLTVDSSVLWVGALLAILAAVLLAYVPNLPTAKTSQSPGLASAGVRITGGTNRRLRVFVVVQIAASFLLLAGASTLLKTLISLQNTRTGLDTRHVLAIDVPVMSQGKSHQQIVDFYSEIRNRVDALPGVTNSAVGFFTPWRDGNTGVALEFSADGHTHVAGQDPRAQMRFITPGFFPSLGVPIVSGRDFTDSDGRSKDDPVVIVSETLAKQMFPNQDAVNRHVYWTDPVLQFAIGVTGAPHRIIGVAADVDDTHVVPEPTVTIYTPFQETTFGGRLFVHTSADPYTLVKPVSDIIRGMSADQPVEHAATLQDIRAEVLTPDRLNTVVFGIFAAVALLIALVGVAGVLAFSVSARIREFGIRLALGSPPQRLLAGVIREGAVMAAIGVLAGSVGGYWLARLAAKYFTDLRMPGVLPVVASALLLLAAAVIASALPAARASRVDVIQALRTE